jgi:FkbM family methyltransferase
MAVWHKEETLTYFISADTINGTSTAIPDFTEHWKLDRRFHVRGSSLSSLLSPNEISAACLIKIDVEGAEIQILSDSRQRSQGLGARD